MPREVVTYSNNCCEYEEDFTYLGVTGYWEEGKDIDQILEIARKISNLENNRVIRLPINHYTEAQALGAVIKLNKSDVPVVSYRSDFLPNLQSLPDLEIQEPVRRVYECLKRFSEKPVMLQIQAPFSILATLIEPMQLYKALSKNREEIKFALEHITKGLAAYIKNSVQYGARIISIADPCAGFEILGEARYLEFAASYQIKLLKEIASDLPHAVVHICPRCSCLLERYQLMRCREIVCRQDRYINILLELLESDTFQFTGHQCIYNMLAQRVYVLEII